MGPDGFKNRYRLGSGTMPHTDPIYRVIYNSKDNSAYVDDPNRVNRRINVNSSRYDARSQVNGIFDSEVLSQACADDAN